MASLDTSADIEFDDESKIVSGVSLNFLREVVSVAEKLADARDDFFFAQSTYVMRIVNEDEDLLAQIEFSDEFGEDEASISFAVLEDDEYELVAESITDEEIKTFNSWFDSMHSIEGRVYKRDALGRFSA